MQYKLKYKWTVSKARKTLGYNICTLYVNNKRVAQCDGGGYDMEGTVLGNWIAKAFPDLLLKIKSKHYGLTFHDPNFDPGQVKFGDKTVDEMEESGESLGLERYQAVFKGSSDVPTETHVVPRIDGACGKESVKNILEAIGGKYTYVDGSNDLTIALVEIYDC